MSYDRVGYMKSVAILATIVGFSIGPAILAGCPGGTPPVSPTDAPFPPTRTPPAVLDDLRASGCSVDGGLVYVEQAHARYDRAPVWDCLFGADGSVGGCGCP